MTPEERQALRDIHVKVTGTSSGKEISPYCLGCGDYIEDDRQPYPCDVIKVLEDYELLEKQYQIIFQLNQELMRSGLDELDSNCDHTYAKSCWCDHKQPVYIYCPKCGEKL